LLPRGDAWEHCSLNNRLQAKAILASVRPRDLAGKTRRRLAVEQLAELVPVEKKIKALTGELKQMVKAKG